MKGLRQIMRRLFRGAMAITPTPHVPSRRPEIDREAAHAREMRYRMDMLAERAGTILRERRPEPYPGDRRVMERRIGDRREGINGEAH